MTAPAGAVVGLYVDLVGHIDVGDVIQTQTGRRYQVLAVRVQERGKAKGRQHLRVVVMAPGDRAACLGVIRTRPHNCECLSCGERGQTCDRKLHTIRWYKR